MVRCVAAGQEPAEGRVRTKRYQVELTDDERAELEGMLRRGRASARRLMRILDALAQDGDVQSP